MALRSSSFSTTQTNSKGLILSSAIASAIASRSGKMVISNLCEGFCF